MTKEELRKIKEIYARNRFLGISAEALILEVERLQSEIERLQSEREWRDIETAPKDGTEILVFDPYESGMRVVLRWSHAYKRWICESDPLLEWLPDWGLWMPLPSAPEGGKE